MYGCIIKFYDFFTFPLEVISYFEHGNLKMK